MLFSILLFPEWRNWQTQQTQNLPGITPRVGSTPSSGTKFLNKLVKGSAFARSIGRTALYTFYTLQRKPLNGSS